LRDGRVLVGAGSYVEARVSAMQRDKGQRAEREMVLWLRRNGYPDARRYLSGDGLQPGDIDGVPGVTIEVKNCKMLAIPAWLEQVHAEAAPGSVPVVAVRRPGLTDPGDWWAVLRWREFMEVVA
jgi:Holliday junction resolvase